VGIIGRGACNEMSRSGARGCGVVTGAMTKEKGDKRPAGKKTEVVPGAICNTSFVLGGRGIYGEKWRGGGAGHCTRQAPTEQDSLTSE